MKLAPRRQPGLLQQGRHPLPRRPRIGRGLKYHQLVGAQHLGDRPRGIQERRQVRLAIDCQRSGQTQQHRVDLRQRLKRRSRADVIESGGQAPVRDVRQIRAAGRDLSDLVGVGVNTHHLAPRLGKGHREG